LPRRGLPDRVDVVVGPCGPVVEEGRVRAEHCFASASASSMIACPYKSAITCSAATNCAS
jgi:hypothetical protein